MTLNVFEGFEKNNTKVMEAALKDSKTISASLFVF